MPYINYQMSDREMWAVTLSAPCYRDQAASMELVAGLRRLNTNKRRISSELICAYGNPSVQYVSKGRYQIQDSYYMNILNASCASQYNDMRMHMLASPEGPSMFIRSLVDSRRILEARLVEKTLFLLPPAGIQAWNIARAIYYIRCCVLLGITNPRTAMSYIMGIANSAQQLYDSWEEYLTAYAVGEQFVSENPDKDMTDRRIVELTGIMTSKKSAVLYFPWCFRL